MSSENVLKIEHVTQRFGGLVALTDINAVINKGEIVGIIGPNGAGKTTLFNIITGYYIPTEGNIVISGKTLQKNDYRMDKVAALGVGRTFQNIRLFPKMTVLENVMMARHCHLTINLADMLFNSAKNKRQEQETVKRAEELLRLMDLYQYRYNLATDLPYGCQKKLEIARALATEPKLLLLDEPAAGMNEQETEELRRIIERLHKMEYTILLIEHDMKFVMNICERLYVLQMGAMIADGTPSEMKVNQRVIEAYLGKEEVI